MSSQKRSSAEVAGGSLDTSKKDDQSCDPSKEDEKRQSGSPRNMSTSVGPLEGNEEPKNITPGSSVSRKGDASSNPLASEKKKDERSPVISNLDRDGGLGRSPEHDVGREDAPSGNAISIEDVASGNPINDEGSHASALPISNTAGDAPKSIRQHRIKSSGGSASRNIDPPVNEFTRGGRVTAWYCGHCSWIPMSIDIDAFCVNCGRRRDVYSISPV